MHTQELFQATARKAAREEQIAALKTALFLPEDMIAKCETYREAVQLAWQQRRPAALTKASLAAACGVHAPHMTQFTHLSARDEKGKRRGDLPAGKVTAFEAAVGNRAISQWFNRHARLTIMEELMAARA